MSIGHIYVIELECGLIKIGHTINLDHRMRDHRTLLGRFRIIGLIEGSVHDETRLHRTLRGWRVDGKSPKHRGAEMYQISPKGRAAIAELFAGTEAAIAAMGRQTDGFYLREYPEERKYRVIDSPRLREGRSRRDNLPHYRYNGIVG